MHPWSLLSYHWAQPWDRSELFFGPVRTRYIIISDNVTFWYFMGSQKIKHNQVLKVKFYRLWIFWRYFVNERFLECQEKRIFWNYNFCNDLICLERITKWNNFSPKLPYLVLLDKIILVVSWTYAKRLFLNRL